MTCLTNYPLLPAQSHVLFGDSEGKLSLLDIELGKTLHLMPNTLVGTGRYRRSCRQIYDACWGLVGRSIIFRLNKDNN